VPPHSIPAPVLRCVVDEEQLEVWVFLLEHRVQGGEDERDIIHAVEVEPEEGHQWNALRRHFLISFARGASLNRGHCGLSVRYGAYNYGEAFCWIKPFVQTGGKGVAFEILDNRVCQVSEGRKRVVGSKDPINPVIF